jgi:hypothetical protein
MRLDLQHLLEECDMDIKGKGLVVQAPISAKSLVRVSES